MNGFHAQRSGDIVLVTNPFTVGGAGNSGTTHGFPYSYDTHVPVGFFGGPFKPGRYADEFTIVDIAPTLSAALGINDPPLTEGKAFARALVGP